MKKLIFGLGMLLATNNMLAVPNCPTPASCQLNLAPEPNQETPAYNCGPVPAGQTANSICVNMNNGASTAQCFCPYAPPALPTCLPIGEFCKENSQCCNNQCFGPSGGKGGYCYDEPQNPNKNDACLSNADCGDGGTCNKLTNTCNPKICQYDKDCDSSNGMYCVPYYTNNNGTQYILQQSFCTYWGGSLCLAKYKCYAGKGPNCETVNC